MKTGRFLLVIAILFLAGCNGTSKVATTSQSAVRAYNGTASVGDFLTISIDSTALTITYKNYTNGETGTVPYTVNADGTYTISDPNGNLLAAYEVPGTMLMVEAANAGPNRDAISLITAIESAPASMSTFEGRNFNSIQFRTTSGGVSVGTISIDGSGNITHASYWPLGMVNGSGVFNSGSFSAASVTEDASGDFFTINESSGADYAFGTQNGFFAVDTGAGTILSLPKATSKAFSASNAGTYTAIFYKKPNAQMGPSNLESGTPFEGKATVTVNANGSITMTDSQSHVLASGTLAAIADTPYIYDGTGNTLPDPLYGMFTFRMSTASSQQDVFVTFQGSAVIFSSFKTQLPPSQTETYTYFYGVGLK